MMGIYVEPFCGGHEACRGSLKDKQSGVFFFFVEQKALRTGTSTRLDERVFAMCEFKTQPLQQLMRMIHPDLYRLDNMSDKVRHGQVCAAAPATPRFSRCAGRFTVYRLSSAGGAAPERLGDTTASSAPPVC